MIIKSRKVQEHAKVVTTGDGSQTLYLPGEKEHYHSGHGALQESCHVFIKQGFEWLQKQSPPPCYLLEVGLGTGLNALLTLQAAQHSCSTVHYTTLESYPLRIETIRALRYPSLFKDTAAYREYLELIHQAPWGEATQITSFFTIEKRRQKVQDTVFSTMYDLVYYDAFAPRVQPELWTYKSLQKMAQVLCPGGGWVSYCAKGSVKRHLKKTGLCVEALAGPPGKREMMRAVKRAA